VNVPRAENKLGRRLAIAASVVVLATVVASVWVTGSPSAQREARLDERRVGDLDNIKDAIRSYTQEHDALPADLAELKTQPGIRLSIADPVTAAPYEYVATGARTYQLCARFTTDTAQQMPNDYQSRDVHWAHGIGRQCFDRTAGTATGLPSD
jgi:type II secretory pathway pseudopilin PulG